MVNIKQVYFFKFILATSHHQHLQPNLGKCSFDYSASQNMPFKSQDINSQDPVMVEVNTEPLQFSNHTIIFIPLSIDHL